MLAISCDPLESHQGWVGDIQAHTGNEVNFPIIADADRRYGGMYVCVVSSYLDIL